MNKINIELKNTEEDQTRDIREKLNEIPNGTKNSITEVEFKGDAVTHGMLSEDLEREYFTAENRSVGKIGDIGAAKIFKIKDKEFLHIKGGHFTNPYETFEEEDRPKRPAFNISENSFLNLVKCNNLSITDLNFKGPHNTLREKTGFPRFYGSKEFEHFIDLEGCQNVYLSNLHAENVYGDFLYFRSENPPNKNITIKDCTIYFNGRQGVAWGDGENILIDNFRVELSGRGGADFEPPREKYYVNNVIIRNSHFKTWLLPFPMGGMGIVKNVLIENNTTDTASNHTYVGGDRVNTIRENIIFRGNESLGGFGSVIGNYQFIGVENLLVENEKTIVSPRRSLIAITLVNSKNVTIRNNDFVNAKYIVLRDTPIEEVKVYGNKQDLKFIVYSYDMSFKPAPDMKDYWNDFQNRPDFEKWIEARNEHEQYMQERLSRATTEIVDIEQYDVEKYGEPDVPKDPDFEPYMGVDAIKPEPIPEPELEPVITTKEVVEVESISFNIIETDIKSEAREGKEGSLSITYKLTFTDKVQTNKEEISREIIIQPISKIVYIAPIEPIPEPETPVKPEPAPIPKPEETKKEWYQNKGLWIIGGVLLIILIAFLSLI